MTDADNLPLFRTTVDVNPPLRQIAAGDRNVFLGSCFAEHVGRCFQEGRLTTTVNPTGVLYNPKSIARLLATKRSDPLHDYVLHDGMWHTWLGDSSLSRETQEECLQATDAALAQLHEALHEADNLFLTFGTDKYYTYHSSPSPVANCHKIPQKEFVMTEMSVGEMIKTMDDALLAVHRINPKLQVVMTVSPYRYQKYGFHESHLSKGRLLLMIDSLCEANGEWMTYFPAYEIVLDELRDYRFYAEDMLHPSQQAVQYVWQRMKSTWFTPDAQMYLHRWEKISRMMSHKSLHPGSPADIRFREQMQEEIQRLEMLKR